MILSICENCEHGSVKNGTSHCGQAAIYSHLTTCLRDKAMAEFLERQVVSKAASSTELELVS